MSWSKTRVLRGKSNGSRDLHHVPILHVLCLKNVEKTKRLRGVCKYKYNIYTDDNDIKIVRTSGKFARHARILYLCIIIIVIICYNEYLRMQTILCYIRVVEIIKAQHKRNMKKYTQYIICERALWFCDTKFYGGLYNTIML